MVMGIRTAMKEWSRASGLERLNVFLKWLNLNINWGWGGKPVLPALSVVEWVRWC